MKTIAAPYTLQREGFHGRAKHELLLTVKLLNVFKRLVFFWTQKTMQVPKNNFSHCCSMMQLNIESESYATSSVCSQDFPNELQAVSIGRRTSIGPTFAALLKGERRSKFPLGRSRSAILSNWRLLETTCSRPLKRMQQHNMQKYILRMRTALQPFA